MHGAEVAPHLPPYPDAAQALARIYKTDSRRILATLIRVLGDFDLAEDSLQEAFAAASQQWPQSGVPENPRAWLITAGRFKGIDVIRRRAKFDPREALPEEPEGAVHDPADRIDRIEDDVLRLVFTCCHPSLSLDARVALTLREVCGLTTEEIARGFLTTPATLAQRIVRAKAKIREARIPYLVPSRADMPDRLEGVLQVIYLVYNEGYAATSGQTLTRPDLSGEAIRLARLLAGLLDEPEVLGLLSLMLLQESRRQARVSPTGDPILLDAQDRNLWNRAYIQEGILLMERALASRRAGPYTLQAAIAAVHARSPSTAATDWAEIVALYDALLIATPSPVVELNRAAAVAMSDGPEAGLEIMDAILARGVLSDYLPAHASRAELCRRLGKVEEARASYHRALELCRQEPERRFLHGRLHELETAQPQGVDSADRSST